MADLKEIVGLKSDEDFESMLTNGSITYGDETVEFSEQSIYVTPEEEIKVPTKTSELVNDSGFITSKDIPLPEETDPTVPSYVKSISETDIQNWNSKSDFSGDYNDLTNKPDIPSVEGLASETYVNERVQEVESSIPKKVSELENDSEFVTETGLTDKGYATTTQLENSANSTLDSAKTYTDEKVANLVGTAPETLDTLQEVATAIQENETVVEALNSAIGDKVDKVDGKGLSTNDFTTEEKEKLQGVEAGANKTVIDKVLSLTSENSVQNKVVTEELNNKVTLDTAQEISGQKTFTAFQTFLKSNDIDKTVTPTSNQYQYFDFVDKNGNRLGVIGSSKRTDGYYGVYLQAGNEVSFQLVSDGINTKAEMWAPIYIQGDKLEDFVVNRGTFMALGVTCYYIYWKSGKKEYFGSIPIGNASSGAQTITYPSQFTSATSYALFMNPVTTRSNSIYGREGNPYSKSATNFQIQWNTSINVSYYEFYAVGY